MPSEATGSGRLGCFTQPTALFEFKDRAILRLVLTVSLRSLSTVFNCVKELRCGHWFGRKWRCLTVTQVRLGPSGLLQHQKSGTGSGVTQLSSSMEGSGRAPLPHRPSLLEHKALQTAALPAFRSRADVNGGSRAITPPQSHF